MLVPVLGLVQVTQAGDVLCRRCRGCSARLASSVRALDPLVQAEGFLVMGKAAGVLLLAEDVAEVTRGRRRGCGAGCAGSGVSWPAGVARAVAAWSRFQAMRACWRRVAAGQSRAAGGEPDPVLGDEAPLVFAAGQRPAGGRVDEVGGDVGDEAGPFPVPPGPLVQGAQALQAAEGVVPVLGVPGEGQGVVQVGFLGAERRDRDPRRRWRPGRSSSCRVRRGCGCRRGRLAGRRGGRAGRRWRCTGW